MRSLNTAVLCVALSSAMYGQASVLAASAAESAARLPVTRVILYKNGVGYFEHSGHVRGSQARTSMSTSLRLNWMTC
jgi:hypothetical protein